VITTQLAPEIATVGLAVGLLLSLVCYLTTNLSPGGMITPGWIALTMVEDFRRAAIIVLMTTLTYLGTKGLQRVVILYGKRLFAAVVLLGVLLQTSLLVFVQTDFPLLLAHETLGFVVPGLIAYQLVRQRPVATLLATGGVSAVSYAILISGVLVGLVPTI
jgi:poly-gamma-glutamate biosynthesis protein PgsC/CapC